LAHQLATASGGLHEIACKKAHSSFRLCTRKSTDGNSFVNPVPNPG